MKTIIAGCSKFFNDEFVETYVNLIRKKINISAIITGMAKGIDTNAWNYGKKYEIELIEMPAEWDKYKRPNGKNPAGMIRNVEMGKIAECLIAFWDLKSPGTKNMIDIAKAKGIPIYLVIIPSGEIKCCNLKNTEDK